MGKKDAKAKKKDKTRPSGKVKLKKGKLKKLSKKKLPKSKCCASKPQCKRCPIRMLKEGTLPPGYTVKRRKLVKIDKPSKKFAEAA
ncbi:hypothetical protein NODU109028_18925 [Nocardioides dubius]|uniref:Uncharacterized protein n=1 Tax=Nocardioides dubius TaxID=317019 RepID=A0ABN1TJI9_9ACTN